MDLILARLFKLSFILIWVTTLQCDAQELCEDGKKWCHGYCCQNGQCCLYYHETWWFWFIWVIIFMLGSCCFYHRDRLCKCQRRGSSRRHHSILIDSAHHPYEHMVSATTIVSVNRPTVHLPSYDEVPVLPKIPPPDYNQIVNCPVSSLTSNNNIPVQYSNEDTECDIPVGTPPPPYSPLSSS